MKMNELSNLISNLTIDAEWAEAHEWDVPICLYDDLWDTILLLRAMAFEWADTTDLLENLRQDAEWAKSNKIEGPEGLEAPTTLYDDLLDSIEIISGRYKNE